ncbi:hypothetical protein GUJ93_ZPchr0012g21738 [Zizania palustris]|uniref:AIG1-type G domain-containing protein n=1 Tax=Zizania palustris TaxID=103762 RepID=A0A8J6BSZ4_ZIZPA|nr:hypothetical protein GUJ93_ZPchr0012g21738 [Zizania palustris]
MENGAIDVDDGKKRFPVVEGPFGKNGGPDIGVTKVEEAGDVKPTPDAMATTMTTVAQEDGASDVMKVKDGGRDEEDVHVDAKQTPGSAAAAAWREAAWEGDSDEFVDVSEGDVASCSLANDGEEEGYGSCADIAIDEDTTSDVNQERSEKESMVGSVREQPDNRDVSTGSKSDSEHAKETILIAQNKSQINQGESAVAVAEEFAKSRSSDNENKATSAPPGRSKSNRPSLKSRPVGLGASTSSLLQLSPRSVRQTRANGHPVTVDREAQHPVEPPRDEDEDDEIREKLQMIRVKFLRLAKRFGQTPHNMVVSQVLYRVGLAEQLRRNTSHDVFRFDRAQEIAERLEAARNEPLDFSCTILVLGKSGIGKSATINSIFDDARLETNAFNTSTRKVQQVVGLVEGIRVKVIDVPGLSCSSSQQHNNQKILSSAKRLIIKSPPDIVLYFDRLDEQTRDYGDVPLLQTITRVFGASIWFNAIVVLTHAASAPPDGPNGIPLSYEMFVTQRSHVIQQAIRQAVGDVRLMNPVSLVENHSACRTNRAGQRVLPNGHVWKPQLLLLCFASKVLAEANVLLKLQGNSTGKPARTRVPPLPFLLSSLLQTRAPLKLPEEQFGGGDDDIEDESDSDDGSDYDDLPPFKRLTKAQLAKLNHAHRKAYLEELDYREMLFYKKQLKEERTHRKIMKKMEVEVSARADSFSDNSHDEDDGSAPTNIEVPMPDMVLPSSFDADYPSHRYRFLDTPSEWLVRPVLETQGWDHDVGYEGLNVERLFAVKGKTPLSVFGQLTKDKKDCSIQMEVASSIKHGEGRNTSLGLDLQSVGKDMAYTIRGESKFKNLRRNYTSAGISSTILGDSVSAGVKIEDTLTVNRQLRLLVSSGAMSGKGDVAYGGRLEATLKDKDYPIGRMLSTLALSIVDWHGDLAIDCNVRSQIPTGRASNLIGHVNLCNKGTGQVGIRLNSSEHLQIALVALVPIIQNVKKLLDSYSVST